MLKIIDDRFDSEYFQVCLVSVFFPSCTLLMLQIRKVTSRPEVQEFLRKELGDVQIRSVYLLKGFIFQPLDHFLTSRRLRDPPTELNPVLWTQFRIIHLEGFDSD